MTELRIREAARVIVVDREHLFADPIDEFAGQRKRYFLVRTPSFEPTPGQTWEQLNVERVNAIRGWTVGEIDAAGDVLFAPRRLASLLRGLLEDGPPDTPLDVGT